MELNPVKSQDTNVPINTTESLKPHRRSRYWRSVSHAILTISLNLPLHIEPHDSPISKRSAENFAEYSRTDNVHAYTDKVLKKYRLG